MDVKLGAAGKTLQAVSTNENGEFEFTGLKKGNYTITVEQTVFIDDKTFVSPGEDEEVQTRAQDHNSSRSNKTASVISNDAGNDGGTYKKGDVKISPSQNSQSLRAQNNNTVRSNRSDNAIIMNDNNNDDTDNIAIDEGGLSNPKGKSNVGLVKWMAPEAMKRTINTTHDNIKKMLASLDDLEDQLDTDNTTQRQESTRAAAISKISGQLLIILTGPWQNCR